MNDEDLRSHILICKNLQKAYDHIETLYADVYRKLFFRDDFLLEDAKSVTKEAYIAENEKKLLILGAKNYNIYAQNSLLKMLEEPPRNIVFILVCETKNVFLPTIRSRLLAKQLDFKEEKIPLDINLAQLDLKVILHSVQRYSKISKNELKSLLQTIVSDAITRYHMEFTTREMEHFERLFQLADMNSRPGNVLVSLLLSIYLKKR
ncbi:DNA polymerase III subunit delta' [Sulfurospirillum sp. 1612]|uniref:DNA polymerase III subunit delta' n=1 Tax=Sulfurospirillum sp. 1612 TaxID=3094835 RepID=UPI002F9478D2